MIQSIIFLLSAAVLAESYKLLVVFPFPGKSHSILGEGFVRHLLQAGHEVTYITPITINNPSPNLHQIDISSNFDSYPRGVLSIEKIISKAVNLADPNVVFKQMLNVSEHTILHENVQNFLANTNVTFDAVIAEWLHTELYAGFAPVFGCPLIWFSSMDPHWLVLSLMDEIPNPAYHTDMQSDASSPFTFWERARELWYQIKISYVKRQIWPFENMYYERAFGWAAEMRGRVLPSLSELISNGSLMLGNSHVSTGEAIRLPQSYKPIGGYHIFTEIRPLAEDLKEKLDNAKHGVIYFSMGSMLKSKDMPQQLKVDLLAMFGSLNQTVLWKFEEVPTSVPKNVHILQWAPQQSILAHPNTLMFITHGGLLSTTEAIHFGKPIIGIPGFADQHLNVKRAVKKGFATQVDLNMDTAKNLKLAIEDVLTHPKYTEKVKELSMIYHHRPVPPGTELVHWVEHVIKTDGSPHLRSPALLLPWYQKMYIDLGVVLIVPLLMIYLTCKSFMKNRRIIINIKKVN